MAANMQAARVDLAELARYDTPTICNAIELFDARPRDAGYMNRAIRACFTDLPPMVGYAATFTFCGSRAPASDAPAVDVAELIATFAQLPGPAVVVIQDVDAPPVGASFGDLSCHTYKAFGARGLITSGAGRDFAQVESMKFPVYVGSMAICSHGYSSVLSVGGAVAVGGLTIYPGDLLHGDRNGVTVIPAAIAAALPAVAAAVLDAERGLLDCVGDGKHPDMPAYREAVASMHRVLADVRSRLAGHPEQECPETK